MANKIRHLFPGGNTSRGFFSYYDYIIPYNSNHIFILKGGPGVGKSTFMRKISEKLSDIGYEVEHHHCSSDNNSLDGLVIPDLQIALIDGTSPHIVDPKNPGCVDEIINLGQFWNDKQLAEHKQQILECNNQIKEYFQRAYRLLGAAKLLYDDWKYNNFKAIDMRKINTLTDALITKIITHPSKTGSGNLRKLFASAITPDGPINYLEELFADTPNIIVLSGDPGTGKSTIIEALSTAATRKGYNAELFFCALDPCKSEHLYLPELSTAVITASYPHEYIPPRANVYKLNTFLNNDLTAKSIDDISYTKKSFHDLFTRAMKTIKKAKQCHDVLESYYIPSMNFTEIENYRQEILAKILTYSK